MYNPVEVCMTDTTAQWSTRPAAVAALVLGGVVLLVAATVAAPDAVGRVLVGAAGILALAMAASAARQRPRLQVLAGNSGLATNRLTGRREYPRAALRRVRIVEYPRLGRRVPMLEVDVVDPSTNNEKLMIFGRWELGTDPRDVFDVLAARDLAPDSGTR